MSNTHDQHTAPPQDGERRIASEFTEGGHEIDRPPNTTLFGFLAAMVIVIAVSAFGVYQLFVTETTKEMASIADQPGTLKEDQAARDRAVLTTYGAIEPTTGQAAGLRMPIATAEQLVLTDPARFAPAPAPEGWVHPDDTPAVPAPAPTEKK